MTFCTVSPRFLLVAFIKIDATRRCLHLCIFAQGKAPANRPRDTLLGACGPDHGSQNRTLTGTLIISSAVVRRGSGQMGGGASREMGTDDGPSGKKRAKRHLATQ